MYVTGGTGPDIFSGTWKRRNNEWKNNEFALLVEKDEEPHEISKHGVKDLFLAQVKRGPVLLCERVNNPVDFWVL